MGITFWDMNCLALSLMHLAKYTQKLDPWFRVHEHKNMKRANTTDIYPSKNVLFCCVLMTIVGFACTETVNQRKTFPRLSGFHMLLISYGSKR